MSNTIKTLGLIAFAALVAVVLRAMYIAASKPGPATPAAEVRVRTVAADLPQGLLLRDTDLGWKSLARAAVPPGAVLENTPADAQLHGAVLRHDMTKDGVILPADVFLANAPGFLSATLKPDMRAVSVAIDDVSGNAGLIQPGDYVDLLLTQDMSHRTESPNLAVASETVVEHARVLAVGSELTRPKENTSEANANTRARTVTLEVAPRTAGVVAVAARLGSLSLALRSFATHDRGRQNDPNAHLPGTTMADASTSQSLPPVWAGDISRAVRALPVARSHGEAISGPAPARPPATVLVYRGSTRADSSGDPQMANLPPLPAAMGAMAPAIPALPGTPAVPAVPAAMLSAATPAMPSTPSLLPVQAR